MEARFFGLTPKDRESLLEQHYFLIRRLGMSYSEARNLPVAYRLWFIDRFVRECDEANAARENAARSANANMDKAETIARAFSR